jgi:uncharacterized membrane protein YvbJ
VICRNCGTEIADKAIICYRCGTGTKEPLRKPAEIRRRRRWPLVIVLVIIVLILLALFLGRHRLLVGFDAGLLDPAAWRVAVLIDFPPGNA